MTKTLKENLKNSSIWAKQGVNILWELGLFGENSDEVNILDKKDPRYEEVLKILNKNCKDYLEVEKYLYNVHRFTETVDEFIKKYT